MTEFRGRARFWAYIATAVVCLIVAAPFAWIFINSIKNQIDIYTGTLSFVPVWTNYDDLLFGRRSDFLLNVQNSAIVAGASTILVMIAGTLAAYSLSRFRFARALRANSRHRIDRRVHLRDARERGLDELGWPQLPAAETLRRLPRAQLDQFVRHSRLRRNSDHRILKTG